MAKQLSIIEDGKPIAPLHDAAVAYADVRDKRIEASKVEVEQKGRVLVLMTKYKLEHYEAKGVLIDVVPTDVKLKVHISAEDE